MSVASVTRQQYLDDVTSSVGQTFLSQPLQCARCHDHKFDPIPTRDYYSVQAVFATTQFVERDVPFHADEAVDESCADAQTLHERIRTYRSELARIQKKKREAERRWYAERGLEFAPRTELQQRGVPEDKIAPRHVGLTTLDFGMERIARKRLTRHQWELDRYRPFALSVYSGAARTFNMVDHRLSMPEKPLKGRMESTAILRGGDLFSPMDAVQPGVVSALASFGGDDASPEHSAIPAEPSGRRSAFARWLVTDAQPLTARSIVNRIWQQHFGRGLAANPNNFGATGERPTHADLLDYLAKRFVDEGWSIKRLRRLIVTSDAYQRSSSHPRPEDTAKHDPTGSSYAVFRRRRLAAEEIRDGFLAVSGELRLAIGGPPIRPEIELDVALQPRKIMGTFAPAYQPSRTRAKRHRRSLYALRYRGLRDPFFEVFNQPDADNSCERRDSAVVAPQALTLLNSQNSRDRAIALAARLLRSSDSGDSSPLSPQVVVRAFQSVLARGPSARELEVSLAHVQDMKRRHADTPPPPSTPYPREVTRNAVEEMNGEPFSFVEKLEAYDDFEADLKPADVDASTRALAELCLVLFNTNEFLFVK